MNRNSHRLISSAAVHYLNLGTEEEQRIISGYFINKHDVMSRMSDSVADVDKYQDLSMSACDKNAIVIANSHYTTALNHYVFGFAEGGPWHDGLFGSCGYTYRRSPPFLPSPFRSDEDDQIDTADTLGAQVDSTHSPVLSQMRRWFKGSDDEWTSNWSCGLSDTEFVPANVLAGQYYRRLLSGKTVHVSIPGVSVDAGCPYIPSIEPVGEDAVLGGLRLLAPILHFIADASVPHHVGSTNGNGHQHWEDLIDRDIAASPHGNVDYSIIGKFLSEFRRASTRIELSDVDGPQWAGMFSVEKFISQIAKRTAGIVCDDMGCTRDDALREGGKFWQRFMHDQASEELRLERKRLFNLAIAGSVHFLTEAYADLVKLNLLKATDEIVPIPPQEKPVEVVRDVPFATGTPWKIPGLTELIRNLNAVFDVRDIKMLDEIAAAQALKVAERFLHKHFVNGYRSLGKAYCPIAVDYRSLFRNLHPIGGLASYRYPSEEESRDVDKWLAYCKASANYGFKARIYEMVFGISALRAFQSVSSNKVAMEDSVAQLRHCVRRSLETRKIVGLRNVGQNPEFQALEWDGQQSRWVFKGH